MSDRRAGTWHRRLSTCLSTVSSISMGRDKLEWAAAASNVMGKGAGWAAVAVSGLLLNSRTDAFFANSSIIFIILSKFPEISEFWVASMPFEALVFYFIESPLFGFLWVLLCAPFFLLLVVFGFGGILSVCVIQSK